MLLEERFSDREQTIPNLALQSKDSRAGILKPIEPFGLDFLCSRP